MGSPGDAQQPERGVVEMARRVQERVLRHDALILDTTVELAAERGWPGVLFPRVTEATGLSERPLRDRYKDRLGLGQQVWWQRLESPVLDAMREVIEVVPTDGERITGPDIADVMAPFMEPDECFEAAAELMIVARYQPMMCTAVTGTLGQALSVWLNPDAKDMTPSIAAKRGHLAALALGLLTYSRATHGDLPDLSSVFARIAKAMNSEARPPKLPASGFERWDASQLTDYGDSSWEHLLRTTVTAIGKHGYDGATFDIITDMAEVSRGMIQGYYATKQDFFSDVVSRVIGTTGMMQPAAGDAERESMDASIAAAVEMRETMRPDRQPLRTVVLEQVRLAWNDDAVYDELAEQMLSASRADRVGASAEAWHCVDQALLWGAGLLAELYPASWELPYGVVTSSLAD
jgi:AcrR family transcriptional regulator